MRSLLRHAAVTAAVGTLAAPVAADATAFTATGVHSDRVAQLPPARQRALADEVARLAIGGQDRIDARVGVQDLAEALGHQPRMDDIGELAARVAFRRITATFGDRFSVDDAQAPQVRTTVTSTLAIPDPIFRQLAAAGVSVWVGGSDISDAPGSESLNDARPAVDSARSWSTIAGAYVMGDKRILVDAVHDQGAKWTLLHEFGHAIDGALGLNQSRVVKAVQPRIAGMMMDRYYYDPDNLDATRQEFVAETLSWYMATGYTEFRAQTSSKPLADYYRRRVGPT